MFIRVILDFYLNHWIGNYPLVLKSSLVIKSCMVVNLLITSLFFVVADYYDLRFGIIPNKLSLGLFICGIGFNLFLSIALNNFAIFIFSIVLTVFAGLVSFIFWHVGFWGGGDFKIFIGLSLSLSFLDVNFLNYLNDLVLKRSISDLNLPICNQFIIYTKVFSVLLNGILMAFIFLSLILIFNIIKNKQLKYYTILSILDFKSMLNQLTTKSICINDLSEGMVLDKYYFKDPEIFNMINGKSHDQNEEKENLSNLNVYKDDDSFYFTSLNRIGLTKHDIELIKELYGKGLIRNPYFQIKKGIPFMPFLTLGYIGFLAFGDFIYIVSSFIKALF